MTPQPNSSSNETPNIGTIFAHKREHFETCQFNLHATDPSAYRNYTLREVLAFISDCKELAQHASATHKILDRSSYLTAIDKIRFQNELGRMCELSESVSAELNGVADQLCQGKKNPRAFTRLEPNILLLRRLIDRVVCRLDSIIEEEVAFDG